MLYDVSGGPEANKNGESNETDNGRWKLAFEAVDVGVI